MKHLGVMKEDTAKPKRVRSSRNCFMMDLRRWSHAGGAYVDEVWYDRCRSTRACPRCGEVRVEFSPRPFDLVLIKSPAHPIDTSGIMIPVIVRDEFRRIVDPHSSRSGLIFGPCLWKRDGRLVATSEFHSLYMDRQLSLPVRTMHGSATIQCPVCFAKLIGERFPDLYFDAEELGDREVLVGSCTVFLSERLARETMAAFPDVFAPIKIPVL